MKRILAFAVGLVVMLAAWLWLRPSTSSLTSVTADTMRNSSDARVRGFIEGNPAPFED